MTTFLNHFLIGALVLLITGATLAAGEPAKVVPMKDFFKNPEKAYFQVSPDGKHISFTQPYQDRMNIFVQATGSTEIKRVTSITDRDISTYFWKGPDRILYLKDFGGDENFHLFSVDINANTEKDLTKFDSVQTRLIDDLKDNSTDVIISMNKRNKQIFDVYRLNVATGEMIDVCRKSWQYHRLDDRS